MNRSLMQVREKNIKRENENEKSSIGQEKLTFFGIQLDRCFERKQ